MVLLGFYGKTYFRKIEKLAKELNVDSKLHFLPPVLWNDLLDWTACADISLVLIQNTSLSYYCAAPNKLYETIMVGVPYIANDFPEMRHIHKKIHGGILVNPFEINGIVSAIKLLLSDSVLIKEMHNRSRNIALSELNWDIEKMRLLDIVSSTLKN